MIKAEISSIDGEFEKLGRGRMGGTKAGAGPGGECVCPKCGNVTPHKVGNPCFSMQCPKCGVTMIRKSMSNAKISTIEEEFEKAQVKGFTRTRKGKMERVGL